MADRGSPFAGIEEFEWDAGNTTKNVLGHDVSKTEAESIFFNAPVMVLDDDNHSAEETRFLIHGVTTAGRLLTAAFTIRGTRIRLSSARDMSRKERLAYEAAR